MKNIFKAEVTQEVIDRVNNLTSESQPIWGKMTVSQMLAHCSVTYEMVYDGTHEKPKGMMKLILKLFVKGMVTGEKPYKKNLRTAPQFLMTSDKNFELEKARLIAYLKKTQELGESHFDNKESLSFGRLSIKEWNNMFYKHLDHHLTQFGV